MDIIEIEDRLSVIYQALGFVSSNVKDAEASANLSLIESELQALMFEMELDGPTREAICSE